MGKLEFDRLDITDFIIILALSIGLVMAIYLEQKELSMSIVSGMFGYVGGSYTKQGNAKLTSNNSVQSRTTETTTNSISTTKYEKEKN